MIYNVYQVLIKFTKMNDNVLARLLVSNTRHIACLMPALKHKDDNVMLLWLHIVEL